MKVFFYSAIAITAIVGVVFLILRRRKSNQQQNFDDLQKRIENLEKEETEEIEGSDQEDNEYPIVSK
jgi:hypothetical protein